MRRPTAERSLPPAVDEALRAAVAAGFTLSCSLQTGRLLAALAAVRPQGLIGESGTGIGVGTAWLASGLGPHGRLVTVEADADRAESARRIHAADPRVQVLTGDWSLLAEHAPFDLFFCDGGGKRSDPQAVIDMVSPGGILVMDDFAPSSDWPPLHDGEVDDLRLRYLCAPELVATEVVVRPQEACVVAVRRAD